METDNSPRSTIPGCGLYGRMFRRRGFWHRRSSSTSVISPPVAADDSESVAGGSSRRGTPSDDTSLPVPHNLPAGLPGARSNSESVASGGSSRRRIPSDDASLVVPANLPVGSAVARSRHESVSGSSRRSTPGDETSLVVPANLPAGPPVARSRPESVGGSSRRSNPSDEAFQLVVPANLPVGHPAAKSSMNASRAPAPPPGHKASSQRRPPEPAASSNGIVAELDRLIYDHQRAKESSTLVRASSGNVMVYGNLGNIRGNSGGKDSSRNVLDYLPKTAKELRMEADARKAAAQQEPDAGKAPRDSSLEANPKNSYGTVVKNASRELTVAAPELSQALAKRYSPEELKEMGNEEYKKGRFAEALDLYERAIVMDPKKASYRSNKAAALTARGRLLEAVRECREAIRMEPSYYKAHHRLATLYLRLGEAEKAIHHFKQARKEASSSDTSRAEALQVHLAKCSEARKMKDYLTLLKESQSASYSGADSAPQVFALQAEALLKLLRHDAADSVLNGAPKNDIDESTKFYGAVGNAYFLMIRGQVDMAAGRFEDAVAMSQKAAQLDPSNREIAVAVRRTRAVASARSRGNELFKASRFAEACVAYGEGLEHDSHNAVLLCNRAACHSKLGHYEKAIEDCNTALIVRPLYSKARLRRADCNAKLERWEASIKDYGVLIQEIPGDEEVSRAMSEAQAQLKKQRGEHVEDTVDS